MNLDPRLAATVTEFNGRAYNSCSTRCREVFIAEPERYRGNLTAMRMTVGVMGSAGNDHPQSVKTPARSLGQEIGRRGFVLISGAYPGLLAFASLSLARREKDTDARVIYNTDPALLVGRMVTTYIERHYRRPSCFCADAQPAVGLSGALI